MTSMSKLLAFDIKTFSIAITVSLLGLFNASAFAIGEVEGGEFFACPGEDHTLGDFGEGWLCVEALNELGTEDATAEFWMTGAKNKTLGMVTGRKCFYLRNYRALKVGTITEPTYVYVSHALQKTQSKRRLRLDREYHKTIPDGMRGCDAICTQRPKPKPTAFELKFACIRSCNESSRGPDSDWKRTGCEGSFDLNGNFTPSNR